MKRFKFVFILFFLAGAIGLVAMFTNATLSTTVDLEPSQIVTEDDKYYIGTKVDI